MNVSELMKRANAARALAMEASPAVNQKNADEPPQTPAPQEMSEEESEKEEPPAVVEEVKKVDEALVEEVQKKLQNKVVDLMEEHKMSVSSKQPTPIVSRSTTKQQSIKDSYKSPPASIKEELQVPSPRRIVSSHVSTEETKQ